MAGSYPDVPSRRMAWDDDGTAMVGYDPGSTPLMKDVSAANKAELNDEDGTLVAVSQLVGTTFNGATYLHLIFPELREVDGTFIALQSNNTSHDIATSANTTNGFDGTWTNQLTSLQAYSVPRTESRANISSMAVSSQRAIRWHDKNINNNGYYAWHVYGEISAGQTPDRLLYIDTGTSLEFTLPIDYGDVPRGSAADKTFKLRNNSSSLTATTIQLTAESNYLSSSAWYTFSDGGAYQATLALSAGSISAASDSATITLRRIVPNGEDLGLHAGRIQVSVGTWS